MNERVKEEPTKVYLTDPQRIANLEAVNATLTYRLTNALDELTKLKAATEYETKRRSTELRDLQAQLLEAQDRITVLQGRLLSLRAIVNTP